MPDVRIAAVEPAGDTDAPPHRLVTTGGVSSIREAAGMLGRGLTEQVAWVDVHSLSGPRLAAAVEGLALGTYRFSLATGAAPGLRQVNLIGAADEQAVASGLRAAAATAWARELANTPASQKSPRWLATRAARELSRAGLEVQVRDEVWLAENGFAGVLAVGGGSRSAPRFVEASWRPRGAAAGVHAVVVGKGITFDTGGLNIKPGGAMRTMHTDMSGAAAVFAAVRAAALSGTKVRVTALAPIAENSVSGSAFRPGDVVRHFGGRTSEITNTDAEGRIVLADALAYAASRLRPTVLVDIATLTGAVKVALGLRMGGLFATSDSLARALSRAAQATGEPLWRLPLNEDYASTLGSDIADANNAPGNPGAITAALFLLPFTHGLPWAHLDIAGPGRSAADDGVRSRGATGFGARLLARWLESLA
ncbi:MAG: leucyl aminopeptidase family protein [Actinomycetota bacterium]|nr:leucyl aminopeptidase family protein [Actinomycetota bacterium]